MPGEKTEKPLRVVLLSRGKDRMWRKRRGFMYDDGSIESKGRTYVVSRDDVDYVPTVWNQLGLSNGARPLVHVVEERAIPLRLVHGTNGHAPLGITLDELDPEHKARLNAVALEMDPIVGTDGGVLRHESSSDLQRFKKMTLARQLVNAASKESGNDMMRILLIAGVIATGFAILLLIFIINKLGILDNGIAGAP